MVARNYSGTGNAELVSEALHKVESHLTEADALFNAVLVQCANMDNDVDAFEAFKVSLEAIARSGRQRVRDAIEEVVAARSIPAGGDTRSMAARGAKRGPQPIKNAADLERRVADYFEELVRDPDGASLNRVLMDLGLKLNEEDENDLDCFGEDLQERLAELVKKNAHPEKVEADLAEIAILALSIKHLANDLVEADNEEVGALAIALAACAEKSGYLADRSTRLLGAGGGTCGSFDSWISPRSVVERVEVAHE